jgi:O-acetyl-ADP-ribose deacetylase (regulator of RNase III)
MQMLHEVTGDILLSKANAIAHGVAPNDHFNQGLALSLREQWPSMYKDFRHFEKQTTPAPGSIWAWMGSGGQRVISLFTQERGIGHGDHAGKASLTHVGHALKALSHFVVEEQISSLALPRLATGVGGLAWKDVYALVTQHLGKLEIPVFIYTTYVKSQPADESTAA